MRSFFLIISVLFVVLILSYGQQQNKNWEEVYEKYSGKWYEYYKPENMKARHTSGKKNIKHIRNWGISLLTLSGAAYTITAPTIALKMNNEALDYASGKKDIDDVNKWSKKKIKALTITSIVCGIGVISGVSCLIYYHNNRDPYGIALADGLCIRDNGLGVAVTKTF